MGVTRATGDTSCSTGGHDFLASDGAVTVTLVQTTGGTALMVQVCAGGVDDNNCTINQTRIAIGQAISGQRKGGPVQNLKLLPLNCGGNAPPPPTPIDYTVTVNYLR